MDPYSYFKKQNLILVSKKKKTCHFVDFTILIDHRLDLKEIEKVVKNLDLAKKLRKLWNLKVTVVSVIIRVLQTILKNLEGLEIRERFGTIVINVVENNEDIKKSTRVFRKLII